MHVTFNGTDLSFTSFENFAPALDHFNLAQTFELNLSIGNNGPSLTMLRNGDHAWLMYLRFNGDSGFYSVGDVSRKGTCDYTLSNGQIDAYPLSFCVELENCYKAVAYFFVNNGARDDVVTWQES